MGKMGLEHYLSLYMKISCTAEVNVISKTKNSQKIIYAKKPSGLGRFLKSQKALTIKEEKQNKSSYTKFKNSVFQTVSIRVKY